MPGGRPRTYTPEEAKRRKAEQGKEWNRKNADRMAAWTKAWREAHPERVKELAKANGMTETSKAGRKAWRAANPEKVLDMRRAKRKRYPEKEAARRKSNISRRKAERPEVFRAARRRHEKSANQRHPEKLAARKFIAREVAAGRLIRQPCSVCGAPETHGHHPDYSRPADVVWLCAEHHRAEHKRLDAEKVSLCRCL